MKMKMSRYTCTMDGLCWLATDSLEQAFEFAEQRSKCTVIDNTTHECWLFEDGELIGGTIQRRKM